MKIKFPTSSVASHIFRRHVRKHRASIQGKGTDIRRLLQPISKQSTKPTVSRTSLGSGSAFLVGSLPRVREMLYQRLRQPSFTFRPALPCVTFRDAGLKLTSNVPSLRYHEAGGRPAHGRARIIQWEQPEIHLHLHPSRNFGTASASGRLPTSPYRSLPPVFRHSLTLARLFSFRSLRRCEAEKTNGGMMMSGIGRSRVIDRMPRSRTERGGWYFSAREISVLAPQTRNYLT